MYSFVITSTDTGRVLDFGTYHNEQCTRDTANDSAVNRTERIIVTIIKHDDDGNSEILP